MITQLYAPFPAKLSPLPLPLHSDAVEEDAPLLSLEQDAMMPPSPHARPPSGEVFNQLHTARASQQALQQGEAAQLSVGAVLHDIAQTTQLLAPDTQTQQEIWVHLKSIEQLSRSPHSPLTQSSVEPLLRHIAQQLDAHVQTSLGKTEASVVSDWVDALLQQPIHWQASPQSNEAMSLWESALELGSPIGGAAMASSSTRWEPAVLPQVKLQQLWEAYKQAFEGNHSEEAYRVAQDALALLGEEQPRYSRLSPQQQQRWSLQWQRLAAKAATQNAHAGIALGHLDAALGLLASHEDVPLQQRLWQEKGTLYAEALKQPRQAALAQLQVARLQGQQGQRNEQLQSMSDAGVLFLKASRFQEAHRAWTAVRQASLQQPLLLQNAKTSVAQAYEGLIRLQQHPESRLALSPQRGEQDALFQEAIAASKVWQDKPRYQAWMQAYGASKLAQGALTQAAGILSLLQVA